MNNTLTLNGLLARITSGILLFLVIIFCGSYTLSAQNQKKIVKNVKGTYPISREISQADAERMALQNAKQEALQQAGVAVEVWSAFGMVSDADGQSFSQSYSEASTSFQNGLVRVINGPVYSEEVNSLDGNKYAVAVIDAEVKTGEQADKAFIIAPVGIAPVYSAGEDVSFMIDFYGSDSYLKIFWFDAEGGSLLYPFSNSKITEESEVFLAGHEYRFPRQPMLKYRASKINPDQPVETIYLLMVATKRYYPFLSGTVTFNTVMDWLYEIPASERAASKQMIQIK